MGKAGGGKSVSGRACVKALGLEDPGFPRTERYLVWLERREESVLQYVIVMRTKASTARSSGYQGVWILPLKK